MSSAAERQHAGPPQPSSLQTPVLQRELDATHTWQGPGGAKPSQITRWMSKRGVIAIRSFVIFIALWWLLALWVNRPVQLPSPLRVAIALGGLIAAGEVSENALISVSRLGISLVIAAVLAIPLGFLMGLRREAEAIIDPVVELLRPISGIAWIPLALFIFGVGDILPLFILVYVAFFQILLNTIAGVRNVDQRLIAAARTMGVGRWAVLRYVIIPAALPTVMVGIRLAFAAAWAAIIAAELIGAPSGLGFAIEWYRELLMSPKVFAFLVVIGIVGYFADLALRALQRWLTPWAQGTELA
ncbi:MAG: ABC transporter permease [Acetobacteraceae bacterium]|nr:ABC transporter permease [Acetobacteraceae bacterium]